MQPLSSCVLTRNSGRFLQQVLAALERISDEIVVVDSGSTDGTEAIARAFGTVRFLFRPFDHFKAQRSFAGRACVHDQLLFVDADEIPDDAFVESVRGLKQAGFAHEAYAVTREWTALGRSVHCVYPVTCPDHPVRLVNRRCVTLEPDCNFVHETPTGFKSCGLIGGRLWHHTFEAAGEMRRKLEHYSSLAAQQLICRHVRIGFSRVHLHPAGAFLKWYVLKGGFRDGLVGIRLARYAADYTRRKYRKALADMRATSPMQPA